MSDNEPAWEDVLVQIAECVGRTENQLKGLTVPPDYRGKLNDLKEEVGRSAGLTSKLVSAVNEGNRIQLNYAAELREHSEFLRLSASALREAKADQEKSLGDKESKIFAAALVWMIVAGIGGFVYGHWFVSPVDFGSMFLTEEKCARAGGEWHQPLNHTPYCLIRK